MRLSIVLLIAVLAIAAGCSGEPNQQTRTRTLTQRQRDSTLAQTKLPGASVVKKSLALSDSASTRAERLNQLPR